MKITLLLSGLLSILALSSCQTDSREDTQKNDNEEVNTKQETPAKMIEYLVGEWQLDAPAPTGNNQQNRANERLTFTEEARYIVYSGHQKIDSAAYRMNEQLRNLYLESEANEKRREYVVDMTEDVMKLKPKQAEPGQGNETYTYRRVGSPSISPQKRGEPE